MRSLLHCVMVLCECDVAEDVGNPVMIVEHDVEPGEGADWFCTIIYPEPAFGIPTALRLTNVDLIDDCKFEADARALVGMREGMPLLPISTHELRIAIECLDWECSQPQPGELH